MDIRNYNYIGILINSHKQVDPEATVNRRFVLLVPLLLLYTYSVIYYVD